MIKATFRTLLPLILAAAIALALFWFMQWLIAPDQAEPITTIRSGVARVQVKAEKEDTVTQTATSAPPPPPAALAEAAAALPAAPALKRPSSPNAKLNFTPINTTSLNVETSMPSVSGEGIANLSSGIGNSLGSLTNIPMATNVATGNFKGGETFRGRRAVPISTRSPCFPQRAFDQKIEGFVEILYVVKSDGSVTNIRVKGAQPPNLFEAAAIEAVRTWYYDEKLLRGATFEVLQKLPFTLDMHAFNGARKC